MNNDRFERDVQAVMLALLWNEEVRLVAYEQGWAERVYAEVERRLGREMTDADS